MYPLEWKKLTQRCHQRWPTLHTSEVHILGEGLASRAAGANNFLWYLSNCIHNVASAGLFYDGLAVGTDHFLERLHTGLEKVGSPSVFHICSFAIRI